MQPPTSIDAYITTFPPEVQVKLQRLRSLIQAAAPEATEKIAYGMPTFFLNGNLVHFAAYKHHIGFYPTPSGITQFAKELSKYATSKGAAQFPLDEELPEQLITKIVKMRVVEKRRKSE